MKKNLCSIVVTLLVTLIGPLDITSGSGHTILHTTEGYKNADVIEQEHYSTNEVVRKPTYPYGQDIARRTFIYNGIIRRPTYSINGVPAYSYSRVSSRPMRNYPYNRVPTTKRPTYPSNRHRERSTYPNVRVISRPKYHTVVNRPTYTNNRVISKPAKSNSYKGSRSVYPKYTTPSGGYHSSKTFCHTDTLCRERHAVLAEHNRLRARHRSSPLQLDNRVNDVAQRYAEHLADRYTVVLPHSRNPNYGENIHWQQHSGSQLNVKAAMNYLYWKEERQYQYGYNRHRQAKRTARFTAVVWRAATRIGVGVAKRRMYGNTYRITLVVNYSPVTNVKGSYRENVLKPIY